ncbi:Arogenate dehydrogenase [Sebaldella termitidis]|uniref:Prephenate dehydrogenase n=1 Tax=Sebaldella termitidis (strain ATCC 33386 / NCTC 11300) TaxID=526218 RepID=D1ALD6_SEBTE|nr:prephenate dehydrogenase [Sebaldella termitidis]ACZ09279.1 Prephenate dehydrogenase [Sebaldella termitidis ATCC 33386]SUI24600.1 Arogenate dehydrogenase [Sebaldella termitidis]
MRLEDIAITVVGLGVVGGSFAEGLKKAGAGKVYGIDNNLETLKKAKKSGIVDEAFENGKIPLPKTDLVIISLYPELLETFILENNEYFKENSIITDVTGIKGKVLREVKPKLRKDIDFILGHPMAGREKRGIDYADSGVFKNANYILIKADNKEKNINLMKEIIEKLGFKNINFLDTEEHDEIIAFTSQLTHAIAVSLINSDDNKYDTNKFIGDSYRDLTRIAKINEDLWAELFLGNKDNLLFMIEKFEKRLDVLKEAVKSEDIETLKKEFRESSRRREQIT